MEPKNYSAKGGPFFEINNGVAKDPVNAGTGGEKFYQRQPLGIGLGDQTVPMGDQGTYSVTDGVTAGQAGPKSKTGGLSAEGDMKNWKPTSPF